MVAERQRRYRVRRRAGEPTIADALIAAGRLPAAAEADRGEINRAVSRLLRDWTLKVEATGADPVTPTPQENAASDVKTVKELIAKAKRQPGKLNYGAGTITTKLTGYLFNKAAGIDTVLVPYNGSAEVAQAVLTRSVDFSFDGPSASLSLIQSGAFRVLAKFDPRPFPPVPDLPIITAEVPNMDEITVWLGLVAPRNTPAAIVDKLQGEVAKILAEPAIKAKADASGLFPATSTPAEFSAFIRKEAQRWSTVVKETGMKYD